jgi:acyl-lipid omega-6 desaturase (Delta-12 desaturase)
VSVVEIGSGRSRGEVGRRLAALAKRRIVLPTIIFALDFGLYATAIFGAVTATAFILKCAFSVLAGVFISLLAIVGHDAVHKSFTPIRWLNRAIGTVAFLPALHPYSRWEYHHNRVHHRFTAQLGVDNAYPPMTVADYIGASAWRRGLYRFKRSLVGQLFYYLTDIWLPKIFLPSRNGHEKLRFWDWVDLALVYVWCVFLVVGIALVLRLETSRNFVLALSDAAVFGFLAPFLVWNMFISFVTIVQHTGPAVHWTVSTERPSTAEQKLRGTAHVVFPAPVDWFFHFVMQHPAHHIHSGVPLYTLKEAERELGAHWPTAPITARWTPLYHWRLTRDCKLYDPEEDVWRDFALRRIERPGRIAAAG